MRSTPEPRSSRVWLAFRRPSAEQREPATESPVRSLQTAFLSGLGGASGYSAALAAFNQVLGDEAHDELARVDGEGLRGELAHAGVLPVADAALAPTATAIEILEKSDGGVFEIGQTNLETVAIDVSEAQLGASMRLLATGDRPRPIRPAGEVQKVAHLGNFCPLALFGPVGGTDRDPSVFWQRYEHGGHRPREVMADD